jgi:hypothetical protein
MIASGGHDASLSARCALPWVVTCTCDMNFACLSVDVDVVMVFVGSHAAGLPAAYRQACLGSAFRALMAAEKMLIAAKASAAL